MTVRGTVRRGMMVALGMAAATAGANGCAHRREAFYPNGADGPGVAVRAPFVNVNVRNRARTASRWDEPPLVLDERRRERLADLDDEDEDDD